MLDTLRRLKKENKIHPPEWLIGNIHYLCMMGSVAYGVSSDTSDVDIYGFCVPSKEILFPYNYGYIIGFDNNIPSFDQWQQHHIKDHPKEYDFTVYNILKYFRLVTDNNPNMIDSLFVPRTCILYLSQVGELVRENRNIFLHKGAWHKFKGYAYSQMHKMKSKSPDPGSKRYEMIQEMGYDTKFAYHLVRLLSEIEEIMTEGTLTLNKEGRREQLKSIRNGDWSMEEVIEYASDKEKKLEEVYLKCDLPYSPKDNMPKIKKLLKECLTICYDDLHKMIKDDSASKAEKQISEIRRILDEGSQNP